MNNKILNASHLHIGNKLCDVCVYHIEGENRKCKMFPQSIPMQMMLRKDFACEKFAMFDFFKNGER